MKLVIKRPVKHRNKVFFIWCPANVWARLNKIWPKWKKKFSYKVLFVALEKTQDFLPFLQTLSTFSRLFPGLDQNCWGNFKTFSRIQDSDYGGKPVHHNNMPPVVKKKSYSFHEESFLAMPKPDKRKQDSAEKNYYQYRLIEKNNLVA